MGFLFVGSFFFFFYFSTHFILTWVQFWVFCSLSISPVFPIFCFFPLLCISVSLPLCLFFACLFALSLHLFLYSLPSLFTPCESPWFFSFPALFSKFSSHMLFLVLIKSHSSFPFSSPVVIILIYITYCNSAQRSTLDRPFASTTTVTLLSDILKQSGTFPVSNIFSFTALFFHICR